MGQIAAPMVAILVICGGGDHHDRPQGVVGLIKLIDQVIRVNGRDHGHVGAGGHGAGGPSEVDAKVVLWAEGDTPTREFVTVDGQADRCGERLTASLADGSHSGFKAIGGGGRGGVQVLKIQVGQLEQLVGLEQGQLFGIAVHANEHHVRCDGHLGGCPADGLPPPLALLAGFVGLGGELEGVSAIRDGAPGQLVKGPDIATSVTDDDHVLHGDGLRLIYIEEAPELSDGQGSPDDQ
jgi:hypothetical protein